MVFVTGDLHGEMERFTKTEIRKLRKGDVLIVCGDFGFVWEGGKKEEKRLKKIGKMPFETVFVTGCHDNYERLRSFPEEEWNGGRTRVISGRLRQLCRGEIYTLEGSTYFAFGGGESEEDLLRAENHLWWEEEQPSEEEMQDALEALQSRGNAVDYVITHDIPSGISNYIEIPPEAVHSRINAFFEELANTVSFRRWYFGKIHQDRVVTGRFRSVYLKAVPIEE